MNTDLKINIMTINNFQIELTEGCTRRCDFCGINQIKDKVKTPNFMTLEMAELIALDIAANFKEKIRIEFAVHGEPLLNPNAIKIVSLFRENLPKSQISIITNGDPIILDNGWTLRDLFEAGLNYLMIDFYDNNVTRTDKIFDQIEASGVTSVKDFYEDNASIWGYKSAKIKEIIVVPPLSEESGKKATRKIHTAGGNLPKEVWDKYKIDRKSLPKLTRCAKPFREMTINYNGNISICCEDWKEEYPISNVQNESLIDIWNGEKFQEYRYILYNKRRDLIPLCKGCNEVSFRVGFLKTEKEYPELIPELESKNAE